MQIQQPDAGRESLCVTGRSAEPVVSGERLGAAIGTDEVESLRSLQPIGYAHVADAYKRTAMRLTAGQLSGHYAAGADYLRNEFADKLRATIEQLSGQQWDLEDYIPFAAGSDADIMAYIVNAAADAEGVAVFPGDWCGFSAARPGRLGIEHTANSVGKLACVCIPSVRNGHLTGEMVEFLEQAHACLLNINLYPTLPLSERRVIAAVLKPVLEKSIISCSFSSGFGMTASQLGVILIHRDHPYVTRLRDQLNWLSKFYNYLAARTFSLIDLNTLEQVDWKRRAWVEVWLVMHDLPVTYSGSYYVKSFRCEGPVPEHLKPLVRENVVRLCPKPPIEE